ncbi:hypothetical protein AB0E69_08615 [Kribbella sp. NPDC026611]|uniref:hypothetical protein n=1 Tax=Kribbella sp. NPDC026611 TaxID=3154911 RepID=UPI0033D5B0E7
MNGVGLWAIALIVLAAAGVVWGIVALIQRQRYIRSLRDRGWTFVGSPSFDAIARLENPPFGLGFRRSPDDQITGRTSAGRPFQVIEYKAEQWSGWVGMVTLSRRLPELWMAAGETRPRYGVEASVVPAPGHLGPGWQIGATDPAFAAEALTAQVGAQLNAMTAGLPGLNANIDGDQLVVLDPPRKDPELLAPWLEQLAGVAAAFDAAPLDRWILPELGPRMSFYHHPDWHWIDVDDSVLQYTPVTSSGHAHRTSELVRGRDGDGPPFVAFRHHWKTTRTETTTDSEGRTQTRTVEDSHSEEILGFQLPIRMPWLQVARNGRGISFESAAFNERFAVSAQDQKFAYDVMHPRQLEYLMANPPAPFRIQEDWVWFSPGEHSHQAIAHCSAFVRGFLARIPRFVWRNLGLPDAPYPQLDSTSAR